MIPLLVSADSIADLRERAGRLAAWIEASPDLELGAAACALAASAAAGEHRAAVLADDREELLTGLRSLAAAEPAPGILIGAAVENPAPVFVFPGEGAQWPGMGLELMESSAVFRARMSECAEALDRYMVRPLMEVLDSPADDPVWRRTDCMQPALFAVAVSLAEVWRSFGVEPGAVVGHCIGDAAAATVSGALSLEEGARVAALWAKAQQAIPTRGGMAAVELSTAELQRRLLPWDGRIDMGGSNGPRSSIASGDEEAVRELIAELTADGVRAKAIEIHFAAHSRHLDPVLAELVRDLGEIRREQARVPFYSAVDGRPRTEPALDAEYWADNIRCPVQFEQAVRAALRDGWRTFIEVSPHPMLTLAVRELGEEDGAIALGTVGRREGGDARLITALVEAHIFGVAVDWDRFFASLDLRPLDLEAAGLDESAPVVLDAPAAPDESLTLRFVQVEVASLLGLANADDVDPGTRFNDLGLDSAAATQLASRLGQATGMRLPVSAVYDFPTAERLAAHMCGTAPEPAAPLRRRGESDEPIAIVGMSCRFPGGVSSPDDLWEILERGTDAIAPFPEDRGWGAELYEDPEGQPREGGFLADAAGFDADFFGISPREALAMDPQQRLLLECAWEALEAAGIDPGELRGQDAGVFTGLSLQDYGPGLRPGSWGEEADKSAAHRLTGTLTSLLSGRLAYVLGLEGPAVSIDTACSSSLVAVHLAAQALRSGECDLALAGGVTVMSSPGMFVEFSRQRGLAPDGRCKSFAAAADGTGWSEGAGLLVLERLSEAEAKGHRPLAL
ncbi:MAG: beta-ketoacyl synthase N-terminal-like domain-containing protein, partial [Solirubrobacterales bacterium]